jgi:hypothetical protein
VFNWLRRPKPVPTDSWAIARMEEDGRTVIWRFRRSTPPGVTTQDYPYLVNIYWRYDGEATEGMPPGALHDRMVELEQRLDPIEGSGAGFFVLAISGNNRKEWIWYVADKAAYMIQVSQALHGADPFPVEFETSDDPQWSNFAALLASVREKAH